MHTSISGAGIKNLSLLFRKKVSELNKIKNYQVTRDGKYHFFRAARIKMSFI